MDSVPYLLETNVENNGLNTIPTRYARQMVKIYEPIIILFPILVMGSFYICFLELYFGYVSHAIFSLPTHLCLLWIMYRCLRMERTFTTCFCHVVLSVVNVLLFLIFASQHLIYSYSDGGNGLVLSIILSIIYGYITVIMLFGSVLLYTTYDQIHRYPIYKRLYKAGFNDQILDKIIKLKDQYTPPSTVSLDTYRSVLEKCTKNKNILCVCCEELCSDKPSSTTRCGCVYHDTCLIEVISNNSKCVECGLLVVGGVIWRGLLFI